MRLYRKRSHLEIDMQHASSKCFGFVVFAHFRITWVMVYVDVDVEKERKLALTLTTKIAMLFALHSYIKLNY